MSGETSPARQIVVGWQNATRAAAPVVRSRDTFVNNGQVLLSRTTDILSNPSGDRMRLQSVLVIDLSTGTITVQRIEFTCLGS